MSKCCLLACLINLFLSVICLSQECQKGFVYALQKCINCSQFAHAVSYNSTNVCNCVANYQWSQTQRACLKLVDVSIMFQIKKNSQEKVVNSSSRLLTTACDAFKGFIFKNNMCINCKDIDWSSGIAKSISECYCQSSYRWNAYYQICGCYIENSNYLYINGSSCLVCDEIATATTSSQCSSCNGGTFGYSLFGCINCSSIPHGAGASPGQLYGLCNCQTGYTFNLWLGECICNIFSQYALTSSTTCQACSSLASALITSCISCSSSFLYSGYVCRASSLINNYNTTSQTCLINYVLATNPVTNQTTRCVCSNVAQFYTNGNACLSCADSGIFGVSTATCSNCDLTAGFFLAALQCIYCKNAPYSTATATISGCLCQTNYYWSAITSSCLCDWTMSYVGTPGLCIGCLSLSNTISSTNSGVCNCVIGYIWNGTQCICNPSDGSFISPSGQCVNCNTIIGAIPTVISGETSCACIRGRIWNSTLQQCVCDFNQNFWTINGVCYDCNALPNTNVAATSSGCQCSQGLTWISTQNICDCPVGYVNMGTYCGSCSVITLPTGATVAGCQICNVSQGFFLSGGTCYACIKQRYTTGSATSAGCICANSTLLWSVVFNSCICVFNIGRITQIINGNLSCVLCSGASCSCGYPGTGTIYNNGICTNCAYIPFSTGVAYNGECVCLLGYAFSASSYPYSCYCSFQLGYYISSACSSCSSLPANGIITFAGCQICSYTQGFLYLSNDTCILCSSLPNTNGLATIAGCGCSTGVWDSVLSKCSTTACPTGFVFNTQNQVCVCNSITSIVSGSTCILCSTIINSTGVTLNSTACACNANYIWTLNGTGGVGSCILICNTATSVLINTLCLNCLTVPFSTGPIVGTNTCQCPSSLIWAFTTSTGTGSCRCQDTLKIPVINGSSCICDPSYAISTNISACFDCRTVQYSSNSTISGSCSCLSNFVWHPLTFSCVCPFPYVLSTGQCICNLTNSVLINNFCLLCSTVLFSTGKVSGTNNCACPAALVWVFTTSTNIGACSCSDYLQLPSTTGVSCICNPAFAIASKATPCFDCRTVTYSTNKTYLGSCLCLINFIWNSTSKTCICPIYFVISGGQCICNLTTSVFIGTSCFNCLTVQYGLGAVPATNKCSCSIALVWVYNASTNSGACICSNPLQIPSNNGSSCICNPSYAITSPITVCLDCRTIIFSTNLTVAGVCGCLSNFVWDSTSLACVCSSPYVLIASQCICDLTISVLIGLLCFNCLTAEFSTGPVPGTNYCLCPSVLLWVFNSSTNSGACICSNSLQIPSSNASSCICNPLYAISSTTIDCFDCRTVLYFNNSTSNGSCLCLSNFVWNSTSLSCNCPLPYLIIGGQCRCNSTTAVPITGGCFVCSNDLKSTGFSTGNACVCQAYLRWNGTACVNICNTTSAYVGNATSFVCVACGSSNTYTVAKASVISCSCAHTYMFWNSLGYCDCGPNTALVISGTVIYCVKCDSIVYSIGQNDSYSCLCPSPLSWNPTTRKCDCGPTAIIANTSTGYQCVVCNISIWANGKRNTTTCICLSTVLYFSYTTFQCVCIQANSVVFVSSGGVHSCKTCNSSIFALSTIDFITCSCQNTFLWVNNTGCACANSQDIIIGSGSTAECLTCNKTIYAVSKYNSTTCNCVSTAFVWSSSTHQCVCVNTNSIESITSTGVYYCLPCNSSINAVSKLNSTACNCISSLLTWKSSAHRCICTTRNSVIFLSAGVYSCVLCNSSIYAVSSLTSINCKCVSNLFVWSPNIGCICSSPSAIIVGTGSTATCLICNSTIYASGKNSTSNVCICLGSLTWQGQACGCASPLIILSNNTCVVPSICASNLVLLPNNTCVSCTSTNYALSMLNSTNCNCLSAVLVWNPTAGMCKCNNTSSIIFFFGGAYSCVTCNATIYALIPATPTTCVCLNLNLTWNSTAGTCGCNPISVIYVQNNIYSCVTCNSAVYALSKLNSTICKCVDSSFSWNGTTCVCPAGSIIGPNFKCFVCPTGATISSLTCNCSTTVSPNSIWNDITKTCVVCGTSAVPNSVAAFYGVACQCISGYTWDVMTNACIFSCPITGCIINCLKIPYVLVTSPAKSVNLVTVRNIIISSSALIKAFYLIIGSDYTSINSMACICQSGMYWNSLTMRCYSGSFNLQ